jgi:hypothetical protein
LVHTVPPAAGPEAEEEGRPAATSTRSAEAEEEGRPAVTSTRSAEAAEKEVVES